jgi:hypothetical protein
MKMQKVYSQGDVILTDCDLPLDAVEVKDWNRVLAYGEITGHAHRVVKGEVRYFRDLRGEGYLQVLSNFAEIGHEDHPVFRVPRGIRKNQQAREVDWMSEQVRTVTD